jgi:hypothetical protein
MRSLGNPTEAGHVEDVNPLICIRGSASPGHSYTMTPVHVKNAGNSSMELTFSVNPSDATTWLKISPVTIPAGKTASIPLTLVVPPNAQSGQDNVILIVGGTRFDIKFSVGAPPPPACLAAGYKPLPGTSPLVFLWLLVLLVIVPVAFWIRSRLTRGV